MLFKNGANYKMTDKEKKELRAKFSFPLKLVYPAHLVRKSTVNRLPDKPRSINIPCRNIFRNQDGETEEWRWANSTSYDAVGRTKYTPRNLGFMGDATLTEMDLELLYFLYYKSPHCYNGAIHEQFKKKSYFMIEDLVRIATDTVSRKAIISRYEVLLNDSEIGLPEKELRALAKAYFIPNVDKLHINQVRVAIDLSVKRDTKHGIENFFELSKSKEFLEARGKIQTALDLKLFHFDPRSRTWRWRTVEGEKAESICKVLAKTLPENAMLEWYQNNSDFKERLNAELEGLGAMEEVKKELDIEAGVGPA